eukprot:TRINITY_DN21129_c0_g1_i1.p1 TRINITY_DN21129_c0_g1~~TRINITY_DN21129_c0_g1_i1.p1  ORF type:complete len:445 (+),score=85.98 TRINITY_DN21129_c0_g1_i1:392-1726(+)
MGDFEGTLGPEFRDDLEIDTASLPPRKRLLKKLQRQQQEQLCSSSSSSSSSVALSSTVVNSPLDNPNFRVSYETVEKSIAAAKAATEAVKIARKVAAEKAAAALKASQAAKEALELAARVCEPCSFSKVKHPKKHVPIKAFYEGEGFRAVDNSKRTTSVKPEFSGVSVKGGKGKGLPLVSRNPSSIDDEELARQLHRAINSSPRISRKRAKLSSELSPLSDTDRPRASIVGAVTDEKNASDAGICRYSKSVVSADYSDWSPVDDKLSCHDPKHSRTDVGGFEEEGSCSLRCNGASEQHCCLDSKDANSVNKLGFQKKRRSDSFSIEEVKCESSEHNTHIDSFEMHHDDRNLQGMKDSPSPAEGTTSLPHKRLKVRINFERRTKSISEDLSQGTIQSVGPSSSWHKDGAKGDAKSLSNLESCTTHCNSSQPVTSVFPSRQCRRSS